MNQNFDEKKSSCPHCYQKKYLIFCSTRCRDINFLQYLIQQCRYSKPPTPEDILFEKIVQEYDQIKSRSVPTSKL